MPIELWTPKSLYALRQDDRNNGTPGYFDSFFTENFFAEDGEFRVGDLPEADRFLAPFVLPYEQGKPMDVSRSEKVEAFRLPYIKPKSPVRAVDVKNISPAEIYRNGGQPLSPEQKFDARTAELDDLHRRAIRNRESWMRARAVIDAKLRIDYDRDQGSDHPTVELNFNRDPSLNIALTEQFWNDVDAPILTHLETWMNRQYLINGGGATSDIVVGSGVRGVFSRNKQVLEALDTKYRGDTGVEINRGINRISEPLQYIGRLESGLAIWSYKDTFDIPTANGGKERVDILNPKDIIGVAAGATGVNVRGPIFDAKAFESGQWAEEIFAKQWQTDDPGDIFMMHQASYLPVPMYPNRVFKARVLA